MLDDLKANNARWAAAMAAADPDLFPRLARGQAPACLWLGCSDSRAPAEAIVGLAPGELFVHRNVANLASPQDANWRAVLQYAVEELRVRHVLVVGHTGCGGVAAALAGEARRDPVGAWLAPVRELARARRDELEALPEGAARTDRLCRLNAARQARNVARDAIVRDAWARGQALSVHGWIYALADGRVQDLGVAVSGPQDLDRLEAGDAPGSG